MLKLFMFACGFGGVMPHGAMVAQFAIQGTKFLNDCATNGECSMGVGMESDMRPYYQGKLDVFCAVYAVLNALQQLHGVSVWHAKRILSELLIRLPQEMPARWEALVNNATDHIWVVEFLLETYGTDVFPVGWSRPWEEIPEASPAEIWARMAGWMAGGVTGTERSVVFRFQRFMPLRREPVVSHWTTVDRFMGDTLFLFDASREDAAVHLVDRSGYVTRREDVDCTHLILVDPASVFLLQRR